MATPKKIPTPAKFDERSRYETVPSSKDGEFTFHNAQAADLNALSFSETSRTPVDGDESRSKGKFRTKDGGRRG